jgi:tRNA (cytidine/uridine-2'-O-)-methyltransferase
VEFDVIEPCGFPLDDRRIRTAALDYAPSARWGRHQDFLAFEHARRASGRRLVLLTTTGDQDHHRASYNADDILMLGSESTGAPANVHEAAELRVRIPMQPNLRSLNMAMAAAIALAEALRQTGGFDMGAA